MPEKNCPCCLYSKVTTLDFTAPSWTESELLPPVQCTDSILSLIIFLVFLVHEDNIIGMTYTICKVLYDWPDKTIEHKEVQINKNK